MPPWKMCPKRGQLGSEIAEWNCWQHGKGWAWRRARTRKLSAREIVETGDEERMSYLTSLLAFSSIMIVLTTLTTVVVEFIHTVLRKRSGDFETLLAQLYRNAIRPTLQDASVTVEEKADQFVEQLIRNPAFAAPEKRWFSRLPVIGALLGRFTDTSFRELSTRQFVEQLRQTEAGKKLAEQGDAEATKVLGKLAWEFERYGEAASTYFRQRATVFSLLVAFVVAAGFNIDAFRLFTALAQDQSLSERVIAGIDVNQLEASFLQRLDAAGKVEPTPSALAQKELIQKEYEEMLASIRGESENLDKLGLPIGTAYYPFCTEKALDPRCEEAPAASKRKIAFPFAASLLNEGVRVLDDIYRRVLASRDGWCWLFNIMVSTGLIGLGAPFWFKTFRTVASLIPGAGGDERATLRPKQNPRRPPQAVEASATRAAGGATPAAPSAAKASPASIAVSATADDPVGQPEKTKQDLFVAFQNAGSGEGSGTSAQ